MHSDWLYVLQAQIFDSEDLAREVQTVLDLRDAHFGLLSPHRTVFVGLG
ncbi:MAG: hypothetical protein SGI99_00420 [Pseudomonadota bacterium]|nr:hypothetical protein [Pseudomonadota bacterium]